MGYEQGDEYMHKEITVYTVITNNHDYLKELTYMNPNIKYVCFTDNPNLKSDTWDVVHVPDLYHKEYKCLPPLKGYSLFIDGNIELKKDVYPLFKEFIDSDKGIGVYKAVTNHCAYKEIDACMRGEKDTYYNLERTRSFLEKEGYPENNGMHPCGIVFRKHQEESGRQGELWFSLIRELSKRDQTTFNYTLWKLRITPYVFDRNIFDDDYFHWRVTH
jgi:hypothetical protein